MVPFSLFREAASNFSSIQTLFPLCLYRRVYETALYISSVTPVDLNSRSAIDDEFAKSHGCALGVKGYFFFQRLLVSFS